MLDARVAILFFVATHDAFQFSADVSVKCGWQAGVHIWVDADDDMDETVSSQTICRCMIGGPILTSVSCVSRQLERLGSNPIEQQPLVLTDCLV